MKTLTFRRPSPNPLWYQPLDLSPMYLNAQFLYAHKFLQALNNYQIMFKVNSGGSIRVNQLQSVLVVSGESINIPLTYLGSQTWFCCCTSVGGQIVGS
ncbi:MAG: hypothetical protein EZS28_036206 [Streblomastix strix]|uniref:Uncharacterized protein n=1 Tax=Streblomastix strix TaxID=222440 RepID=A0A5J4UCR8_9EUKA|nr:MAG: hypothetical protein EZS28_036206 [Streblomastix strix]